ncbi:hypothetical protein SISNIDRAFT_491894 [Sistotremastrum niveocremeum HHB9708]|uniref:Uncharacterized protein n=1 Tax=Sistotremastrum niveocremeum HHB9708 TaxID=1314777 RepID=A0A164MA25_9AGAM|nr:hypothetical protein SISNIDRAFT_491894 [Sistotremastrum niveocremeum HHB9708]
MTTSEFAIPNAYNNKIYAEARCLTSKHTLQITIRSRMDIVHYGPLYHALLYTFRVFQHLPLSDIIEFGKASQDIADGVAPFMRTVVDSYLNQFAEGIRDMLFFERAIIAGPAVTALILGLDPLEHAPRLSLFCPEMSEDEVQRFFYERGYDEWDGSVPLPPGPLFVPSLHDDFMLVKDTLVKLVGGELRVVDVYTTIDAAEDIVPEFAATAYMSFIYGDGIVMLYPEITFDRKAVVNPARILRISTGMGLARISVLIPVGKRITA